MLSKHSANDSNCDAAHDGGTLATIAPTGEAAAGDTGVGPGSLDTLSGSKVGPGSLDTLLDSLDTGDWQFPDLVLPLDFHWVAYHPKKFDMDTKKFVSIKPYRFVPYSPSSPAYDPLGLDDIPDLDLGPSAYQASENNGTKRKSTEDVGANKRQRVGEVSV